MRLGKRRTRDVLDGEVSHDHILFWVSNHNQVASIKGIPHPGFHVLNNKRLEPEVRNSTRFREGVWRLSFGVCLLGRLDMVSQSVSTVGKWGISTRLERDRMKRETRSRSLRRQTRGNDFGDTSEVFIYQEV